MADIAVGANGHAAAVWTAHIQDDRTEAWASTFNPETGWSAATRLGPSNGRVGLGEPKAAVDAQGNVVAVWTQSAAGGNRIQASRYVPGNGWGPPVTTLTSTGSAAHPDVGIDSQGNVIAVWFEGARIASASFRGGAWSAVTFLSTFGSSLEGTSADPQIAVAPDGQAVAVWKLHHALWSSRYE